MSEVPLQHKIDTLLHGRAKPYAGRDVGHTYEPGTCGGSTKTPWPLAVYRGTSLIRKRIPLGPYRSTSGYENTLARGLVGRCFLNLRKPALHGKATRGRVPRCRVLQYRGTSLIRDRPPH